MVPPSSHELSWTLVSASSISFVSERLAQALRLQESTKEINVKAVIVPQVTCDLPSQPLPFKADWSHLADLTLADPDFGRPGKIDLLLGVEVFSAVVRQGRQSGMPGSPSAFETDFGWVLAGETNMHFSHLTLLTHHTTISSGDDLLHKFWEIEEQPSEYSSLSPEEQSVVEQFRKHHSHTSDGPLLFPCLRNLR